MGDISIKKEIKCKGEIMQKRGSFALNWGKFNRY
jgi:hypothetical protein